jgi:asparagine synthase (glutamine-hydrolysing)
MCGIAGGIDAAATRNEHITSLQRMLTSLAHRGPDGQGIWVSQPHGIALGHRRLAIQDLSSAGHQPMLAADGRWGLVYNGELYNASEIRRALPAAIEWRGHSDTEVLLQALIHWGVERTLPRLTGMFAFAFWDESARSVTLVRDRLGIKPLYYSIQGNRVWWASELKALLSLPAYQADVDRVALAEFLRYGYVSAPRCILNRTWKLLPGTWLRFHLDRLTEPTTGVFWDPREVAEAARRNPATGSSWELIDATHTLLKQVTHDHLVSDVPVGAFLSGGIASSLIAALMRDIHSGPIASYSIGFHEPRFNEAPYARKVAERLGFVHHERYISADDAAALVPQLAEYYCEPLADTSTLPTMLVSRGATEHTSVALSGDGGDELFAGYRRYRDGLAWRQRLSRLAPPVRRALARLLDVPPERVYRGLQPVQHTFARSLSDGLPETVRKMRTLLRAQDSRTLYECLASVSYSANGTHLLDCSGDRQSNSGPQQASSEPWEEDWTLVENMQRWDCSRYLPNDILPKVDTASMAVGLEVRVPLLDHRVYEWAWRLPSSFKLDASSRSSISSGKRILRDVLELHLPRGLFERPKRGFSAPMDGWLRGVLRPWGETLLEGLHKHEAIGLNAACVHRYWHDLQSEQAGHARIWPVLVFLAWHEHYLGNRLATLDEHHIRNTSHHSVSVGG